MFSQLSKSSKLKQFLISIVLIVLVSAACYFFSEYLGYKVVAFILLLTVSLIATVISR